MYGCIKSMKMRRGKRKIAAKFTAMALVCSIGFGGCGLADPLNNIVNQIDSAINAIDVNSTEWQQIVRDLMDQLPEAENDLIADIDGVLKRGIAAGTVSVIATGDFIARRAQEGLDRIKAQITGQPIPVYPPAFIQVDPNAVRVERVRSGEDKQITLYGYDFDRLDPEGKELQLFLIRDGLPEENVTDKFGMTTHYEAVINLGGGVNPIEMELECLALELRWNGEVLSTLPFIQPKPPEPEDIEVSLQTVSYVPPHVEGDREFDGNGPHVMLDVRLLGTNAVDGRATALKALVEMSAQETEDDWTTAAGVKEQTVYTAEPGYQIIRVLSPVISRFEYTDTNHSVDQFTFLNGNLVRKYSVVGDTSSDKDAGTHTKVTVTFHKAMIRVIKDDPYFK